MTNGRDVIVLGRGGHARVVVDALQRLGVGVAAYVDDVRPMHAGEQHDGRPVFSSWRDALETLGSRTPIALGIGDNRARLDRGVAIADAGGVLMTVVHDSAVVSHRAEIGPGCFVGPLAIINSGAQIGMACIINSSACVEHDCRLGDAVHLAPSAVLCGWCSVGDRTLVGASAALRDRISVGSDSVIGLGAVVVSDVGNGITVKGNPAKLLSPPKTI